VDLVSSRTRGQQEHQGAKKKRERSIESIVDINRKKSFVLPSPGFHLPVRSACLLAAFSDSSMVASIWIDTMALRSSSWLIFCVEHIMKEFFFEQREEKRKKKRK